MPEHTTSNTSTIVALIDRRGQLIRSLRALPRLYAELEHCLVAGDRKSERVTRRGAPGIPLNTVAVDVRDDIRAVLSSLTASEVATRWRIAPGTVYWLANERGWRRYRDGRRVYYNLDDVVKTMEQREVAQRETSE